MLKAIIFDFDGVIADTFEIALRLIHENGKIVSRKQYRDHHDGNVFEKPAIIFSEEDGDKFYEKRIRQADVKHLFPLKSQIEELSKSHKLIIISSTREKLLEKYLAIGSIKTFFSEVLGKETHKSKVEKFKMIFKEYGLKPEECIFVTDTLGDLREAKKVGVPTIAVTWGYHGKTRLKKGSPNLIIHDFEELTGAIEKLKGIKKHSI